jgi:hypothetical protein
MMANDQGLDIHITVRENFFVFSLESDRIQKGKLLPKVDR